MNMARGDWAMSRISALLLGLAFVVAALYFARETHTLQRDGGRAIGTIVDERTQRKLTVSPTSTQFSVTHAPIVEFADKSGQTLRFKSKLWSSGSAGVGEQVAVLYNKADPADARIDSFLENWFLTIVLGILGVCSLLYAFGFTERGLEVESTRTYTIVD